jgi:hypothetical protein
VHYAQLDGYYEPDQGHDGDDSLQQFCRPAEDRACSPGNVICGGRADCMMRAQTYCNNDPKCGAVRVCEQCGGNWTVAVNAKTAFPLRDQSTDPVQNWSWYLKVGPAKPDL